MVIKVIDDGVEVSSVTLDQGRTVNTIKKLMLGAAVVAAAVAVPVAGQANAAPKAGVGIQSACSREQGPRVDPAMPGGRLQPRHCGPEQPIARLLLGVRRVGT
jgi:hypothetical protein